MANITHLQMSKAICADARVSVSKSFFGLFTKAVYRTTNSIIDAEILEFSTADGERLKRVLESPRPNLAAAAAGFLPKPIVNGNYMAEVCASRDAHFVAVRLYQYDRMNYEPVTALLVFEGEEARIVRQLF
ncbi:MAG: hypothetical protein J5545_05970 [Bacteroidaceae bacterium]|nr:hypothetical protein [Bacteroidaceae bacterium]